MVRGALVFRERLERIERETHTMISLSPDDPAGYRPACLLQGSIR